MILFISLLTFNSTLGKGPSCNILANNDSDKGLFNLFIKEANFKNPSTLVCNLWSIKFKISQKIEKFIDLLVYKG